MQLMRYPERLSDRDVLTLLKLGVYRVDPDTGEVFGRRGNRIQPFEARNGGHLFVRLYWEGKHKRIIGAGKLCWMAVSGARWRSEP